MTLDIKNLMTKYKIERTEKLESLEEDMIESLFYDFKRRNNSYNLSVMDLPINKDDFKFAVMRDIVFDSGSELAMSGVLLYKNIPTILTIQTYLKDDDQDALTEIINYDSYSSMYKHLVKAKLEMDLQELNLENEGEIELNPYTVVLSDFVQSDIESFFIEHDFKVKYAVGDVIPLSINLIPSKDCGLGSKLFDVSAKVIEVDEKCKLSTYNVEFEYNGFKIEKYLNYRLEDIMPLSELDYLYRT